MNKKMLSMIIILAIISGFFTGCENSEKDKVLRIAYFPNITHTQALIMKEQKKMEEKLSDWKVEWLDFNAGSSEMEAFFADQVDIGYIGPVPAVSGNVKSNGDIQIIAGATEGGSVLVARKGTDIKSVKELEGKKVAIPSLGNTQHLLLLKLLTENQMKPTSSGGGVEVIAVDNSDTINLMDLGNIDAALVPEPWGSNMVSKTGAEIVLDYDKIWSNGKYSTTVVISRKEFMEQHSDIVKIFMNEHDEVTNFIKNNQKEAATMANKQIKELSGKEINVNILNSAFQKILVSTLISKESIMEYADISKNESFIHSIPKENELFNETFLK